MRWMRSTSPELPLRSGAGDAGVPDFPSVAAARGHGPFGFWEGVRLLIPVVRAAMEFCWLYPWIVVVGGGFYGPTGAVVSAGSTFVLLVGGQAAARWALARARSAEWRAGEGQKGTTAGDVALRRARILVVGLGTVLGLASVWQQHYSSLPLWHPAWLLALLVAAHDTLPSVAKPALAALLAALLWWRGLALGARETTAFEVEEAYKLGVAMIAVYLVAAVVYAGTRGFEAAGVRLPSTMMVFFFLGLCALALSRLAAIWERGRPDERAQVSGRAWLLMIGGIVGLIVVTASTAAGLAATDTLEYLAVIARPLLPIVEALFVVLFFVAGLIARLLFAILSRIPRRSLPEIGPVPSAYDDLLRRLREFELHPQVISGARWGLVAAVLLAIVAGMVLTMVLVRRRARPPDEDERESVWSMRDALRGLESLLPRIGAGRPDGDEGESPGAAAIRRAYRRLLEIGTLRGAARPAWATPREHHPALAEALAAAAEEVAWLTDAYERVRYGTWRPASAEAAGAQAALRRIEAAVAAADGPTLS